MITHLHVRSNYSLLSSTLTISEIVATTKAHGMDSIALCDEDVLYKALEFIQECHKENIKPIIGLDKKIEDLNFVLLAKNDFGFQELIKISKKPIVLNQLNTDNLIVILYPKDDILKQALIQENHEQLQIIQDKIKNLKNLYLGITNIEFSLDNKYNHFFKQVFPYPAVALSYILYKNPEDDQILDMLTAIKHGYQLNDRRLPAYKGRHFRSIAEMEKLYTPEELQRTTEIAQMCNLECNLPKNTLPVITNEDPKAYLTKLCQKGLFKRRQGRIEYDYQERLNYELAVIKKMNFENYFLVAWDLALFAAKNNIYVGPGRGSAAGSLVAYCLGITKLDPLHYNIPFERFLNPERNTMPDIDIDIPDAKRHLILDYVVQKYGQDHVAHIVTFSTLKAKQCLRDVAEIQGLDQAIIERIIKNIVHSDQKLPKIMEEPQIKELIATNQKIKKLFEASLKIEDFPRHLSTHASGVVLCQEELNVNCPTVSIDNQITTQYTMNFLEPLGLIKMDFLGLKNLSIVEETIASLPKPLNIMQIPLNDAKTYHLLAHGHTLGIFQLESSGITELMMKYKPQCLDDIAMVLSLYRPGPMKSINKCLAIRFKQEQATYLIPELEPILAESYGIIVYQDQIMQIVQKIAGFSLDKADLLRRAMSKKDSKNFKLLKDEFITQAQKNHISSQNALELFEMMQAFSNYGYNKAHAYSYALLVYQMAYLKANFSPYFYCSLFNNVIGDTQKTYQYLLEAKKMHVVLNKPSLNKSAVQYKVIDHHIYYPLSGIKTIGRTTADLITKQTYANFIDFIVFCVKNKITQIMIESLINAGALDEFQINRTTLKHNLNTFYTYCDRILVDGDPKFYILTQPNMEFIKSNKMQELINEKEVLGFYFSSHPFVELRNQDHSLVSLSQMQKSGYYKCLITINKIKQHTTKQGKIMCFLSVSDELNNDDFIMWEEVYLKAKDILKVGNSYQVNGFKENGKNFVIKTIVELQ